MNQAQLAQLVLLAALWGASFLFMRMTSGEFSPAALVFVRVAGAAALLLPLLWWRQGLTALRRHWQPIMVVGVLNSALPFVLFMVAASTLNAGLMAIFNSTAPIWGALIAWLWLGERLGVSRVVGLAVGFAGVLGLAWGKADFATGAGGVSPVWGMAACLLATLLYGISGNYSRKYLVGVSPMAVAAGSQAAAALALAVPAWLWWPAQQPSARAWSAAAGLAVACTALAYWLYFRLIAQVGASKAMTVTFLIPAFGMLWGWTFLNESLTASMLLGGGVILAGTALAAGVLKLPPTRQEP